MKANYHTFMKKITSVFLLFFATISISTFAQEVKEVPKTKVVCNAKQKCKTVKIHKKLQGTKVPAEAKKKK